jgi:hypothetical protein
VLPLHVKEPQHLSGRTACLREVGSMGCSAVCRSGMHQGLKLHTLMREGHLYLPCTSEETVHSCSTLFCTSSPVPVITLAHCTSAPLQSTQW